MKHARLKSVKFACLFVCSLFLLSTATFAQKKKKGIDSTIVNAIAAQRFVFVPQQMLPMTGSVRQLSADYSVKITGDTLVSYLPYFGRAYVAPINSSKGPLDFTLTKFTVDKQPYKKDGWQIKIKPSESRDIQQFLFTIFNNGVATLQVSSTNRQPVSYNGYLKAVK